MKYQYRKGFAPLVIIYLVVLGIGVVGGGLFLYKEQRQEKLETRVQDLQNQPVGDTSDTTAPKVADKNPSSTTIPTTTTTPTSNGMVDLKINDSDGPYTFKLNSNPVAKLTWTSTGIVNGTCKIDNLRGEKGTVSFKELSLSGYTHERVGSGEIVLTCSENSNFDSSNNPQDIIRIYDDNPDVSSSCLTSDFDDRRHLLCGCNSTSGFSKTTGKSCRIESYGE